MEIPPGELLPSNASMSHQDTEQVLFSMMSPLRTGIKFINHLTETADMNGFFYEYYYNGAGVSVSDIDNDGLQDILFISSLRENHLYLNQGGLTFKNITIPSGLGRSTGFRTGVTNVDINNDGWMDYYVSKSGKYDDPSRRKNELWINQGLNGDGIPVFKEQASGYNLDIEMCSTQAVFFDYDMDGDLDMFLVNHYTAPFDYREMDKLSKKQGILTGDRLYQNRGGKFVDVTTGSGIANTSRLSYGLGVSVGDLNNDQWPDVYVSNDYEGKDYLYLNNGNSTFREVSNAAMGHTSFYSMGTDIADVNNDGWLDIMSLDMMAEDNYTMKTSMSGMDPAKFWGVVDMGLHYQYMYNALQINNGPGPEGIPKFSDIAQLAGVASTDWSWGPLFFDMNNDGFKDIFVPNGIKKDFRNNDFAMKRKIMTDTARPKDKKARDSFINRVLQEMPGRKKLNYFFKNNGDLSFENKTGQWVLDIPTSSNGAAYADLDNDGDLEIIVNNSDDVSMIYKNNTIELGLGNYLRFDFSGPGKNIFGMGARVKVRYGDTQQIQEHYLTRGFQSSVGTGLHFGLGKINKVDTILVTWPDGKQQQFTNTAANQTITLSYDEAARVNLEEKKERKPLFATITATETGVEWRHEENFFNDFERESLLPHKLSAFGPALAIGDFDGDGLEDFFLGGAKNQKPVLYKQKANSSFEVVVQEGFADSKKYEDVDAVFFDADRDGDLDLYVVSGGNEAIQGSPYYQDRIYENNNGKFVYHPDFLPSFAVSGSCVCTFDFDEDGDLDLFVGGRQYPGRYPTPVSSYLLRNDSEKNKIRFTDITAQALPQLREIGMVTDAICVDLNQDNKQDLVLVGEWMQPRIFYNAAGGFREMTTKAGFENTTGWWNAISAADFDSDGDLDLVAGNLGLNYKYKASNEKPFKVYATDFDQTGTFDIVLGYYEGSDLYPLRGRQCSSGQMPFIKKKFPTYDAFARATLEDVYGEEQLGNAIQYSAHTFATTYFENQGNGSFQSHILPKLAQITSVNDMVVEDFDQDGKLDLILAGNLYGAEVETPRNDAGIGLFLQGDGHGNFHPKPMYETGLHIEGEARHMSKIELANRKTLVIIAVNNERPVFLDPVKMTLDESY